jgi:hypothetical protein
MSTKLGPEIYFSSPGLQFDFLRRAPHEDYDELESCVLGDTDTEMILIPDRKFSGTMKGLAGTERLSRQINPEYKPESGSSGVFYLEETFKKLTIPCQFSTLDLINSSKF